VAADPAPVYDRPFAAFPDPNAYRFHSPAAIRFTIARFVVQMHTRQAIWAMVPVIAPRSGGYDQTAANFAIKTFCTGIIAVISF